MIEVKADRHNDQVLLKLRQGEKLTRAGIRWAFFELGRDLNATADREILKKPKHGRTYIVRGPSGRRRRHRASAPGEAHANLTGKLRKSKGWQVRGSQELTFGYGVADQAPDYAPFVERGTRRMGARPTLKLSVDANIRNAELHFARQIQRRFEV
jgi:hypothetical protein